MQVRAVGWWLTLAIAAAACGGRTPPAAGSASDSAVAKVNALVASAALPVKLHVAADTAPPAPAVPAGFTKNGFPHDRHRALKCQRCHTSVPGHTVHTNVECTSCHAPVPASGPLPTPDQCQACHHGPAQTRACTTCHTPSTFGTMTLHVTWKLSVWPTPRQRDVSFNHTWHTSLACQSCHTNAPVMLPTRECASCHVHHEGNVDCRNCHRTPPAGAHNIAVHATATGCTGSGCHQSPPVHVANLSRDECLVCHADRVNHQPGKVCATCHMVPPSRPAPAGKEPDPR